MITIAAAVALDAAAVDWFAGLLDTNGGGSTTVGEGVIVALMLPVLSFYFPLGHIIAKKLGFLSQ